MTARRLIPVIGILGGIASGKSRIAQLLCDRGAVVLDADKAGHEVLRHPDVESAARARWGNTIFEPSEGDEHQNDAQQGEQIVRSRLAAIVFAPPPDGPRELKYLEQLTHERIGKLLKSQIEAIDAEGRAAAIVLDAAVMLKAGWNDFCDHIVYVDAPRSLRVARAAERGWSEAEFDRREAAQESLDVKRKLADVVIDNSLSLSASAAQIDHVWPRLVGKTLP